MHSRVNVYDDCQWQRGLKQWLFYSGLCIVMGVMDWVGWLQFPKGILERIVFSIGKPTNGIYQSIVSPFAWVKLDNNSSHRIADLESRLAAAAVDQARLHELEEKVTQLESITQSLPTGKRADRIVELINQDGQWWIAAGQEDQLKPNQLVLDSHGVFIGKVGQIGQYTSKVVLPGDADYRLTVQTTSGAAKGVIERVGSKIILTGVLQTETLQEGDILVTTATGDTVLPQVVVAQVTKLSGSPSDPTKGAEIMLLADKRGWASIW